MRDQSKQGGVFIAGLALAIALCMPACLAGEGADEDEPEGPVASAHEVDTWTLEGDTVLADARMEPGLQVAQTCAPAPRTGRVDFDPKRCPKHGGPSILSDPPPMPWKTTK